MNNGFAMIRNNDNIYTKIFGKTAVLWLRVWTQVETIAISEPYR